MEVSFFLKGLIIGVSIAAPVGPIGILCIRLALTQGGIPAIVAGLGAATADALYGALAGFGVSAVSEILVSHYAALQFFGAIFILYLGGTTFFARPAEKTEIPTRSGLALQYASTLLLTLTNPVTILSFAAVFAGLGLGEAATTGTHTPTAALVGGIFLGSTAWWLLLATVVAMFKRMIDVQVLQWINRIAGTILLGFGLLALVG